MFDLTRKFFAGFLISVSLILAPAVIQAAEQQEQAKEEAATVKFLVENLEASANELGADFVSLDKAVTDSEKAMQYAKENLDKLIDKVGLRVKEFDENGEIWTRLDALMNSWQDNEKIVAEKATNNPAFEKIADKWAEKIDGLRTLRNSIGEQHSEMAALLQSLIRKKDLVVEYIKLGAADEVLKSLGKIHGRMVEINQNMSSIVDQATTVAGATPN